LAFVDLLQDGIRRDQTAEERRVNLSTCADFNLNDAFDHFVFRSRTSLDLTDLQKGLEKLGVIRSYSEIEVLVRKWTRGVSSLS